MVGTSIRRFLQQTGSRTGAPVIFKLDSSFITVNSDDKHIMNDYRLEELELHRLWASFLIMDATHGQPFLLLPHFIVHLEGMMMA